jgi:hypothetical protein
LEDRAVPAIINALAGNGTAGFSGDGGPATNAQLNFPVAIATDSSGNVYIDDQGNNVIRKVTPSGTISTVAGNGTAGFSGDGRPATNAQINGSFGIAVDGNGDLFIADTSNNVVREVTPDGLIHTIAGTGTAGFSGDNGPATAAQLNIPAGLTLDSNGDLFIADRLNNRIREVTPQGIITTVAGNGTGGFSGDGGPATNAQLDRPDDVAIASNGDLFIADEFNGRVRVVMANGIISTFAGGGNSGLGDGGPATAASFNTPVGVAVDASGNVFIVDRDNNRIREVTTNGFIYTVAGGGSAVPGNGGPATNAQLFTPDGVVVDHSGNLYIVEENDNLARIISPLPPQISPSAGNNQTAPAGTAVATPPAVFVQDAYGNPAGGVTVTFAVASGGGSITGATATTNAAGIATVGSWTLGTVAGSDTLTATAPGFSGSPLTITASAVPGPSTQLVFGTQPSDVVPGQFISPAVTVLVEDRFGNVVTSDSSTVSIALSSNPNNAVLKGNTTVQAVNGRASFANLNLSTFGAGDILVATDGSLSPATSQPFNVDPITITPSATTVLDGQPVTFNIRVFALAPANGNPFGTVTLTLGGTILGTVPVNPNGQATFTTPLSLLSGASTSDVITATYNDPIQASTTVTVVATSGPGVPVAIVLGPGASGTTGVLADGAGSGTLAGVLQTNSPLVGQFVPASDTLVPNFGDDNLFSLATGSAPDLTNLITNFTAQFASRSSFTIEVQSDIGVMGLAPAMQMFTLTVSPPTGSAASQATVQLTSSANPVHVGASLSLTAQVTAPGGTPTGAVFFQSDGNPLGSATLVNGSATFTTTALSMGTHTVTAVYAGDGSFSGSSSTPLSQAVATTTTLASGIGAFDAASGTWYLRNEDSAGAPDAGQFAYGLPNWKGVVGDWNGDGTVTVGVVDPLGTFATWYLRNENSPGGPDATGGVPFAFGLVNWIPIAGDWTGSGHTGIGMFDPTTNTFYLENNPGSGKVDFQFQYGAPGWIPVAGDWNHSGHAGIGMIDPTTMTWYLRSEVGAGAPDAAPPFAYGALGWRPVVGDWNGDGTTTVGLFDPAHFTFYLRNENNAGAPDAGQFAYGFSTWVPVAGAWSGLSASGAMPASAVGQVPATLSTESLHDAVLVDALVRLQDPHDPWAADQVFSAGL